MTTSDEIKKVVKEQVSKSYDRGFEDGWRECNKAYEEMIGRITAGKPTK
jgi:hypothetical protein